MLPELAGVSVFVFNTGGFRTTPLRVDAKGHYELGGFTDATFRLMAILEGLQDADWPFWESGPYDRDPDSQNDATFKGCSGTGDPV